MTESAQAVSYVQTLGGLGLFLLGMIVMTDALRTLAGQSMRNVLMHFTRNPVTGALTGAASTALLQSSSATTVAAVGFVGAGLMSFSSALGIVFGANLGTTITGWVVTLVGFKLKLVTLMLPCILAGALLRLLFSGRVAMGGLALSGFGLIFVGIDQMQEGMSAMRNMLDQLNLPTDTYGDRLKLLGIGVLFTVITQSSSAGVAAVLTALFTEAITLGQGLALVIGMDIGTTVTAVIASTGGTVGSRRTGYSHLVYNILTGICAFLLLEPYLAVLAHVAPNQLTDNAQVVLVGFHSGFNLLGVMLILPFTGQFARLMIRLIPEKGVHYTGALDKTLLPEPAMALKAVQTTVVQEFSALLGHCYALLHEGHENKRVNLNRLQQALDETHRYIDDVTVDTQHHNWHQLVEAFHILDHLQRLHERFDEEEARAYRARAALELSDQHKQFVRSIEIIMEQVANAHWSLAAQQGRSASISIQQALEPLRNTMMHRLAGGDVDVPEATGSLEAIRWMSRVAYHIAQITCHLEKLQTDNRG